MPRLVGLALACAAFAAVAGCEHDGRLLVVVNTDYEIPNEIGCIRVLAGPDDASFATTPPHDFALRGATSPAAARVYSLPMSFVVRPKNGDSARRIRIELTLHQTCAENAPVVGTPTHRIVRGFVPNETRVLAIHMSRACEAVVGCATYCQYGQCYATEVLDPRALPLAKQSGQEGDLLDAGIETADSGPGCPADAGTSAYVPIVRSFENRDNVLIADAPDSVGSYYYVAEGTGGRVLGKIPGCGAPAWPDATLDSPVNAIASHTDGAEDRVMLLEATPLPRIALFGEAPPVQYSPPLDNTALGGPSSLTWRGPFVIAATADALQRRELMSRGFESATGRYNVTASTGAPRAGVGQWAWLGPGATQVYGVHTAVERTHIFLSSTISGDFMPPDMDYHFQISSFDTVANGACPDDLEAPTGAWIAAQIESGTETKGYLIFTPFDGSARFDQPLGSNVVTAPRGTSTRIVPTVIAHRNTTGNRIAVGGTYEGSDLSVFDANFGVGTNTKGAWFVALDCTGTGCVAVPGTRLVVTSSSSVPPHPLSLVAVDQDVFAVVRVSGEQHFYAEGGAAISPWPGTDGQNDVLLLRLPPERAATAP